MTSTIFQPEEGYVIPSGNFETERDNNELVIRFDIEAVEKTEEEDKQQYKANEVRVAYPADYGAIVSAIIEDKYPDAEMQAIINNYLVSPEEGDHTASFVEMQNWRKHAKDVAHKIVG